MPRCFVLGHKAAICIAFVAAAATRPVLHSVLPTRMHANIITACLHGPPAFQKHYSGAQQWNGPVRVVTRSSGTGRRVGGEVKYSDAGGMDCGEPQWGGGGMGGDKPRWDVGGMGGGMQVAKARRSKSLPGKPAFLDYR